MKREVEYGLDDLVNDLSKGFTYGVIVFSSFVAIGGIILLLVLFW